MWIHTRPRTEQENAYLINLAQASRVNISKIGERWFIEAMIGTEAFPLAMANSVEEAHAILKHIFDKIHASECALDLEAERE
jgi:hypothetical protein